MIPITFSYFTYIEKKLKLLNNNIKFIYIFTYNLQMFSNLKTILLNNKLTIVPVIGLGGYFCTETVPPSHVAYSNLFGKISNSKLESGIHLKNPFAEFIKIPLLTTNLCLDIDVATKEGLNLSVQTNLIYRLDEDKTLPIYLKFKKNYDDIFIKPIIESKLRNLISSYEAKDLYNESTRLEIKEKMFQELTVSTDGFVVEHFLVNKIKLPHQLQQSIENKLKAEQENEQMAFIIDKEKKQITFSIEKEKLEAERKTIEANGIKAFVKN